jgi:hypothetical protein
VKNKTLFGRTNTHTKPALKKNDHTLTKHEEERRPWRRRRRRRRRRRVPKRTTNNNDEKKKKKKTANRREVVEVKVFSGVSFGLLCGLLLCLLRPSSSSSSSVTHTKPFERSHQNERATGSDDDDDDDDIDTNTNDRGVGEKDIARLESEQRVGVFTSAIRSAVDTRRAARGKNLFFVKTQGMRSRDLIVFPLVFRSFARERERSFSPFQTHVTPLSFFCPCEPTNTNRAARHLRTRMITCSSGRRRFAARKTPRGKAGFFPYG